MLPIRLEEARGALVVTPLVRSLDAEVAPELRTLLLPHVRGRRLVVLSLSHVAEIDASGAAVLVAILKGMPPGGEVRLAQARPAIRAFLSRALLDDLFPEFDDTEAALPAT